MGQTNKYHNRFQFVTLIFGASSKPGKMSFPNSTCILTQLLYNKLICSWAWPALELTIFNNNSFTGSVERRSLILEAVCITANLLQPLSYVINCPKKMLHSSKLYSGPIFLRQFRLYVLSFMFRFMFANICFEKNQNIKIYVMFIINIT